MNNTASRIIRSEEITIDMRICTILAGGKKPGEVYFAAIAPDMELTVITLDEVPDILPCFDESDVSINLPDTSLLLTYNPAQVLKLAGKRYLTGPVILVRTNMDSDFISLTIDDVYRFQKFLASHSVTLMADNHKLPCMTEIAVLRTHIVNYTKTRPVYDAYRKAGYSKRFLENHRAEITLHKAAKTAFDEAKLKKLPKVKELDAEYSKLLTEKKAAYPDYRKAKDEMQELLRAQRNVELFFAEEKNTTEKTQSR